MAKFRKQKKQKSKIARPTQPLNQAQNDRILPILANLKSADFNDRVLAIGALNSMVDDPSIRSALLKEKLLQTVLSHTLSDSSQEIVSEGFGLLRNVILEEGRDPAVYLFRQNIFVTIKASLAKCTDTGAKDMNELAENIVSLCSGLVLADDSIYDSFAAQLFEAVLPTLAEFLASPIPTTVDAVLELLYLMSEDESAVGAMVNSGLPSKIEALKPKSATAQVYRYGTLYNLMEVTQQGSPQDLFNLSVQLYESVKNYDFTTSASSSALAADSPSTSAVDPKQLKDAVLEAAKVRAEINAVQVAFEIFASIMESWSHIEQQSPEFTEFVQTQLAPLSLKALQYPNYVLRACSTLNNIGWTLNLFQVEWQPLAEHIWERVPALLQLDDTAVLASAIGLLASITTCLEGQVPLSSQDINQLVDKCVSLKPQEINLAFDDTREFMQLVQALVPFLCSVGRATPDMDVCRKASTTVFDVLETPALIPMELLVECINGLFDLFGDNEAPNNAIYVEQNLDHKLRSKKNEFKRALKQAKGALKEQADEALLNLDRFIAYKQESL